MKITFEDWEEKTAELQPERTQAFFADDPELRALERARVKLYVPRTESLTAEYLAAHPELRQYVAEQSRKDFHLVRLGCSFKLDPEEPFTTALLEVDLQPGEGASAAPIAWSMHPLREAATRGHSTEFTLGPKLKLGPGELSAQQKVAQQLSSEDVFLEALAEGTSEPAWQFNRVEQRELRGSHPLLMVVQNPHGAGGKGLVSLSVVVRRKKFGPLTYRALFHQRPTFEFVLPPRSW